MSTLERSFVRSDKDVNYTGALAQNVSANANLAWPHANKCVKGAVREIRVTSDQNLAWEVQFYAKDTFDSSSDMDAVCFLGGHSFSAGDGVRNDGAGNYYYIATGLNLYYEDLDKSGEVHVKLVNRSATSKNAGATGEVVVEIAFEVI